MKPNNVVDFTQYRKQKDEPKKRRQTRSKQKGSVFSRGKKLWVKFYYLGEAVREPSGLEDTTLNRKHVRKQLNLVMAEIDRGEFKFADRFPHSSKVEYFSKLEGRDIPKKPDDLTFKKHVEKWLKEMEPGMSFTQIQDYRSILNYHLIPYFGKMTFDEIWLPISLKKFIAVLKTKKNRNGEPLSGRRIQNIMIPLRVILRDAADEFGWYEKPDPFVRLKLPKARKIRIYPFSFKEWKTLMEFILPWYRPYFEFAVQTGLRPSEQVALKWSAIDDKFVHIELSRVKNREKADLKTEESRRGIEIRPSLRKVIEEQRELTKAFESPYVFINTQGRPILQDKTREIWARAMKKSGLRYRRMYETRHTFASWALGAGEIPEWVARTLGHVDTSMIYKTYGRYIPNLTRNDGSAFERLYLESTEREK